MVKDHKFEDLQERILELLTKDQTFIDAVHEERRQRFPNGVNQMDYDEITCMCQIIVGRQILRDII